VEGRKKRWRKVEESGREEGTAKWRKEMKQKNRKKQEVV
jgi:hypothetical protein